MASGIGAGSKRKRVNEEMGRNAKTAPIRDDMFSAALLQGIDTVADTPTDPPADPIL